MTWPATAGAARRPGSPVANGRVREGALCAEPYDPTDQVVWDEFVGRARNSHFFFHRGYLKYHGDRFIDASLIVRERGRVVALMPASAEDGVVTSHGGLTFGGIMTKRRSSLGATIRILEAIVVHLATRGVKRLVIKPTPHIYHTYPCEEDLYALVRAGAQLTSRELGSVIVPSQAARFMHRQRPRLNQARSQGVHVKQGDGWEEFFALEEALLEAKYDVRPVHTGAEMRTLASRFPGHITLLEARRAGQLLAGTIIYETARVAHAQYIATTDEGRRIGALDVIFDELIGRRFPHKPYLSLGVSTTEEGFNASLVRNKESYGARGVAHDRYALDIR